MLLSFRIRDLIVIITVFSAAVFLVFTPSFAQQPRFRNAPASASQIKNPYAGNAAAAAAGKKLYGAKCVQCHGKNLQGMGPAPALDTAHVRRANSGELFWFISNGNPASGMPSWSNLPKQQRWQLVTFLQTPAAQSSSAK